MNPPIVDPSAVLMPDWPELALYALLVLALSALGSWWIVCRRGRVFLINRKLLNERIAY